MSLHLCPIFVILRKLWNRNNLKTIANDSLDRFVAAIAVFGNPENIKSLIEEIKKLDIPNIENNVNS